MASATGHITRTIDLLFDAFINNRMNNSLVEVFKTLKLRPILRIEYRFKGLFTITGENKMTEKNLTKFNKGAR